MQVMREYRFSLRGLLLFVTALSVLLGTYSLFEVVGVTLALVGIGSAMYWGGLEYNRTAMSVIGLLLSLTMSLLTCLFVFSWLTMGQGPIFFQASWPPALRKMSAFSSSPLLIKARRDSKFRDYRDDFRWRMGSTPEQHAALVKQHGWEPISVNELPTGFCAGFPAFWRPRHQRDTAYHRSTNAASSSFSAAGDYYFAMYDPKTQLLHVQYINSD